MQPTDVNLADSARVSQWGKRGPRNPLRLVPGQGTEQTMLDLGPLQTASHRKRGGREAVVNLSFLGNSGSGAC